MKSKKNSKYKTKNNVKKRIKTKKKHFNKRVIKRTKGGYAVSNASNLVVEDLKKQIDDMEKENRNSGVYDEEDTPEVIAKKALKKLNFDIKKSPRFFRKLVPNIIDEDEDDYETPEKVYNRAKSGYNAVIGLKFTYLIDRIKSKLEEQTLTDME